jgi:glycosyltransferase involved in cell wall biosynthesis
MEKKSIIYEGTILSYAVHSNSSRSGIFVETYETFRQFINQGCKVIVICDILNYFDMRKAIKVFYPGESFDVMYYVRWKQSLGGNSRLEIAVRNLIKTAIFLSLSIPLAVINRINGRRKKVLAADAFVSTAYVGPAWIQNNDNIDKYYCVQDAIPLLYPEYYPQMKDKNFWYNCFIRNLNERDHYFAISEATKNDFCRIFPKINENQFTVVYLGKNERYRTINKVDENILTKYGINTDTKYFFSLCTVEPRKNLLRSVRSFIEYIEKYNVDDLYYVIGGGKWNAFYKLMVEEFKDDAIFNKRVKMIGYVDDDDLPHLYNNAMCFIFTSQYEGFGLPALEAMSCGCPVITSNSSSLPEVVGDAGITVQWDSDEEHVEAYRRIYADELLRDNMHRKSLERAKLFSWQKCAEAMLQVINT